MRGKSGTLIITTSMPSKGMVFSGRRIRRYKSQNPLTCAVMRRETKAPKPAVKAV